MEVPLKFKVGDVVKYAEVSYATVVEWEHTRPQRSKEVAVKFEGYWNYREEFPHSWVDESEIRKVTKLEIALK